ncbi:hypothetical protein CCACVL1_30607 [Corchorus capsularis]|uniref:Uncharacterized protein n=1 Tax=Corchorus capsularis TaxID=210143 RepID=A0A1R3FWB9_COCAP|nr:hypothetical protein CCACVL1_30607 [Corchorus capsularis]
MRSHVVGTTGAQQERHEITCGRELPATVGGHFRYYQYHSKVWAS